MAENEAKTVAEAAKVEETTLEETKLEETKLEEKARLKAEYKLAKRKNKLEYKNAINRLLGKEVKEEVIEESLEDKPVKVHKIPIPKYSLGEELISSISHGLGALFGIVALVLCVVVAVIHGDPYGIVSAAIFGASLIILYSMSTIYHALKPGQGKRVLRVFDHLSIYFLIAGTYTPFSLVALREANEVVGWTIFGFVWGISIIGIIFNAINVEKFKVFSMITYLGLGWVIIFAFKPLTEALPTKAIWLLIGGGLFYTIGAIIYGIGSRVKYMHSIWHFFVLGGSVLHFLTIIWYVL